MAKKEVKSGGPARIRMVMIDAELPEGADIGQITQAIQNALTPGKVLHKAPGA
jgi:hypothetical protein